MDCHTDFVGSQRRQRRTAKRQRQKQRQRHNGNEWKTFLCAVIQPNIQTPNIKIYYILRHPCYILKKLPFIMSKCFISFCHSMCIFSLFHNRTFFFTCIYKFLCKFLTHRFSCFCSCRFHYPIHSQCC